MRGIVNDDTQVVRRTKGGKWAMACSKIGRVVYLNCARLHAFKTQKLDRILIICINTRKYVKNRKRGHAMT